MATDYNKAYWQTIKADPEKLAAYRARRRRNQAARRQRNRDAKMPPSEDTAT